MIRAAGRPLVLMAGGGTGGHLFPGVAVAERLAARMPGARVLLAATAKDRASHHIAACPLELVDLHSPRLPPSAASVPAFGFRMTRALLRSYALLRDVDPDAVIGLGGYGSVAPVLAARSRRIPAIVLEQNAVPGKATRLLGRFGAVAATSFPGLHARGFKGRARVTGNPLRRRVLTTRAAHAEFGLSPDRPVLGMLGGSLGARGLNERFARSLPALAAALPGGFQVLHAAGSDGEARAAEAVYAAAGVTAHVRPFFEDMGAVYGTVDVVLSRAGGTTVAELTALGIPAVFVPYPHHRDAHQRENAAELVRFGAAAIVEEHALTPYEALRLLVPLLADPVVRDRRSRAMREFGRPDAADRVVDLVLELTKYAEEGTRVPAALGREESP